MAQTETYRVWYRDGSARLIDSTGHKEAAQEAQELATIQNAPAPKKEDKEEYRRYLDACKVRTTESLTTGKKLTWK